MRWANVDLLMFNGLCLLCFVLNNESCILCTVFQSDRNNDRFGIIKSNALDDPSGKNLPDLLVLASHFNIRHLVIWLKITNEGSIQETCILYVRVPYGT